MSGVPAACRLEISVSVAPSMSSNSPTIASLAAWTSVGSRSEPKLFDIDCTSFTQVDMLVQTLFTYSSGETVPPVTAVSPVAAVALPVVSPPSSSPPHATSTSASTIAPATSFQRFFTQVSFRRTLAAGPGRGPGLDPPGVAPGRPTEDSGG